ncbi:hypothetical protein FIBSPDRAFT_1000808 [Athelia psychrophila]|uniref:Uncharacterized protein n=1 Tax=Athelia psychrophila TaxID=1759441 RepID=A0A166WF56_9AGAM|nr:hypothetical protein FIBSPDRAFT_1000808 [Fibularhizoctonia sp. CBS 109695]
MCATCELMITTFQPCVFSNLAGTMGVALTGTWEFSDKRGAVLMMHLPQPYNVPNNKLLNSLVDVKELKGKHIVSDAYTCPASSLDLSGKSESLYSSLCPLPSMISIAGDKQVAFNLHAEVDPSRVSKLVVSFVELCMLSPLIDVGSGTGVQQDPRAVLHGLEQKQATYIVAVRARSPSSASPTTLSTLKIARRWSRQRAGYRSWVHRLTQY